MEKINAEELKKRAGGDELAEETLEKVTAGGDYSACYNTEFHLKCR